MRALFENLLNYRRGRYLWWALALALASIALFVWPPPVQPRSGGTWQGYVLGSIGAALILWLALLGIRKRRYASTLGTVQGWVSAHVYLGLSLLLVATLHTAFQFGWNVHTLAYVLMCVVVVSGAFGTLAYLTHPRRMSANRAGGQRQALFAELYALDEDARALARRCEGEVSAVVESALERTAIGGGVVAQLSGRDRSELVPASGSVAANTDQAAVIAWVSQRIPRAVKGEEVEHLERLLSVLSRRQTVLRRIRRDIRLAGSLGIWLYVHVPLTAALIAALVVHVVTTFVYW